MPQLPTIVKAIGICCYLGLTMGSSVAADLVAMFSLHIYLFYIAATAIYSWHLSVLYSLFNVFRGGLHHASIANQCIDVK